jgi:hypothetical protein
MLTSLPLSSTIYEAFSHATCYEHRKAGTDNLICIHNCLEPMSDCDNGDVPANFCPESPLDHRVCFVV